MRALVRSLAWNVYKDLYLTRASLLFYSAMILVFAGLFSGHQFTPLFAVLVASVVMVPSALAYLEERNRGLTLQRCLPVPVAAIVAGKYLALLLTAAWLAGVAIAASTVRLRWASPDAPAGPLAWALGAVTAAMLVPAGISLWAFFRWGYQAIRHAAIGFWVLFMALLWPFTSLLDAASDPGAAPALARAARAVRLLSEGAGRLARESPVAALAALAGFALALYGLSAVAATRALRRRED